MGMKIEKERLYESGEVAEAFGVCAKTIKRWVQSGKIKSATDAPMHAKILGADIIALQTQLSSSKRTSNV
jgi:predicted site-specific integrase-resolvase